MWNDSQYVQIGMNAHITDASTSCFNKSVSHLNIYSMEKKTNLLMINLRVEYRYKGKIATKKKQLAGMLSSNSDAIKSPKQKKKKTRHQYCGSFMGEHIPYEDINRPREEQRVKCTRE